MPTLEKPTKILDGAIEKISDYILRLELGVGDTLPPESVLCAELGISRTILREALRHYRTLGIIESRPRTGTVIASLAPRIPYADCLRLLGRDNLALKELAQMRTALETGFVPFMVSEASGTQIDELFALCDELDVLTDRDARFDRELKFHAGLLRCANNSLLDGMIPLIEKFFEIAFQREPVDYPPEEELRLRKKANQFHRFMAKAIRNRDAAWLLDLLSMHGRSGYYLNHRDAAVAKPPALPLRGGAGRPEADRQS